MAPNPRRREAALRELYEQVPEVPCKGACHGACCFIGASVHEVQKIERLIGRKFETLDRREVAPVQAFGQDARPLARFVCSALTEDGRCSVYDDRPMICRIFGTTEKMRCYRGCQPERMLSDDEARELYRESIRAGGGANESAVIRDMRMAAEREPSIIDDFIKTHGGWDA